MLSTLLRKTTQTLSVLFLLATFFSSCQKELSNENGNPTPVGLPDLTTKVVSSVSGFVTDENNAPVLGATVEAGTGNATTDKFGYFQIRNIQVVKNAAVVTVIKPGYFKGIKTYVAKAGKAAFFRIKLMPKNTVGNINTTTGGAVTLTNGLSIALPANSVVNASTNAVYTGTVNVAAYWINPTSTDLNKIMPGNLSGLNTDGLLRSLTTYGMAAVELTSTSGELLQIASGKKATLTFPIPSSILSAAPASIPLWYFDEAVGLWKEQGSAVKTGTNYVGDVTHFSFWNCDWPQDYVYFDCTVVNTAGQPIPYTSVRISEIGNPANSRWGWTDSSGYVGGLIPDSAQLLVEVFSDWSCGTASYSQNFTTQNTNVSLGTIMIANANISTVSGTVTDCNNNPVTNGYALIQSGYHNYRQPLSNTGTFTINMLSCGSGTNAITAVAIDNSTMQQSSSISYTITNGANNIGTLNACGTSIAQFFNYTLNGTNYSFTAPIDSFYQSGNPQTTPSSIVISANGYTSGMNSFATLSFSDAGIAVGSAQPVNMIYLSTVSDSLSSTPPLMVNITEYGPVGQFIAGNFSGTLTGQPPANTPYSFSGNFRIRRRM